MADPAANKSQNNIEVNEMEKKSLFIFSDSQFTEKDIGSERMMYKFNVFIL